MALAGCGQWQSISQIAKWGIMAIYSEYVKPVASMPHSQFHPKT
jgi:hypothetical protein